MNVLLISTYDLGHQPFGLASPAAWLEQEGATVQCVDLSVERLPRSDVQAANIIACYVPMHTATRLAEPVAEKVRELNPTAHLCFYGLYAPMNEDFLRKLGADTILGGEFENGLVSLVRRLSDDRPARDVGEQPESLVSLDRQQFIAPNRTGLPELEKYSKLVDSSGQHRRAGYTEATRGCKHLCRHCPIVPVYGGRFRVVQTDVVLADIESQVEAGAEHITFGDPDFFNGPRHAVDVVTKMHERFPDVTYDVTIKVEHIVKNADKLSLLRDTGCVLVTCAVEAFDETVLEILDKRHTKEDFAQAVTALRSVDLAMNPTFVSFTPWTSLETYLDFLETIRSFDLVPNVSPIQYAIRLLIPSGSRLLELNETQNIIGDFDEQSLSYAWSHPDPRMDELHQQLSDYVQDAESASREEIHLGVLERALRMAGRSDALPVLESSNETAAIPHLDEPWYCCAEPTDKQLVSIEIGV